MDHVDVEYYLPSGWNSDTDQVVEWLDCMWYVDVLDRDMKTHTTIIDANLLLINKITLRTRFL